MNSERRNPGLAVPLRRRFIESGSGLTGSRNLRELPALLFKIDAGAVHERPRGAEPIFPLAIRAGIEACDRRARGLRTGFEHKVTKKMEHVGIPELRGHHKNYATRIEYYVPRSPNSTPHRDEPGAFDVHARISGGPGWATTQVYPAHGKYRWCHPAPLRPLGTVTPGSNAERPCGSLFLRFDSKRSIVTKEPRHVQVVERCLQIL